MRNTLIAAFVAGCLAVSATAASEEPLFTNPAKKQTEDYITGRYG